MKRQLLIAALSIVCIYGMSQGSSIKVPDIQKFVRIDGENVNLYKQPNTQSALLRAKTMHSPNLEKAEFSWIKKQGYTVFHLPDGKKVPVIKEVNGWNLIYINCNIEAYVPADKCVQVEPRFFIDNNEDWGRGQKPEKFGLGLLWTESGKGGTGDSNKGTISYCFWNDTITIHFDAATYKHEMITEPIIYKVKKFVVAAQGKKLHVRKEPNAAAPELVFCLNPNHDFMDWEGGGYQWDKNSLIRSWVTPKPQSALAVIGETGNWYQVYVCLADDLLSSGYVQFIGYVLKSDCTDAQAKPITGKFITEKDISLAHEYFDATTTTIPQYGQLLITAGGYTWGGQHINIARLENNVAIFCTQMGYFIDDKSHLLTFYPQGVPEFSFQGQQYCKKIKHEEWTELQPDLTKLPQAFYHNVAKLLSAEDCDMAYVNVNNQYLLELDLIFNGRQIKFDL